MTEAVDTLDCGNGRGDHGRDDKDDNSVGVSIRFGPNGSGNDGDPASPLRLRGGGLW